MSHIHSNKFWYTVERRRPWLSIWLQIVHGSRRSTANIPDPVWVVITLILQGTASCCDGPRCGRLSRPLVSHPLEYFWYAVERRRPRLSIWLQIVHGSIRSTANIPEPTHLAHHRQPLRWPAMRPFESPSCLTSTRVLLVYGRTKTTKAEHLASDSPWQHLTHCNQPSTRLGC